MIAYATQSALGADLVDPGTIGSARLSGRAAELT
jgi:hypothetical protein